MKLEYQLLVQFALKNPLELQDKSSPKVLRVASSSKYYALHKRFLF